MRDGAEAHVRREGVEVLAGTFGKGMGKMWVHRVWSWGVGRNVP